MACPGARLHVDRSLYLTLQSLGVKWATPPTRIPPDRRREAVVACSNDVVVFDGFAGPYTTPRCAPCLAMEAENARQLRGDSHA